MSSTGASAVILLAGLAATPWLLRWLGETRFGAVRVTTDAFGYVGLVSVGLGGALPALLARAVSRGDASATRAVLATGIRAFAGATLLMGLGGLAVLLVLPRIVPVPRADVADLMTAGVLAIAGIALTPAVAFRSLAEASQRGAFVSALGLVQSLTTTTLCLVFAARGLGLTGQLAGPLFGAIVFSTLLVTDGTRRVPGAVAQAMRGWPDADTRRALMQLNWPTLLLHVCGRLALFTDNIVISFVIAPAAVVPFFVTQRLAQVAQAQLQGVGGASWAAMAELHARGHLDAFRARLLEVTRLIVVLSAAALVPIVAYNRHFIALWVGPARYAGDVVTAVAATNAALLAVFSFWSWCFVGIGATRALVPLALAGTAVNVVASVVLTAKLGLPGPLLGTLASMLFVNAWLYPVLLRRFFAIGVADVARVVRAPLGWALLLLAVFWAIAGSGDARGWARLAIETLGCAAIYLGVWWVAMLSPGERALWRARLG